MDNEIFRMKYELPKSPASALGGEYDNVDDSDNDVQFVGMFANKAQSTFELANLNKYANNQQNFGHANLNGNYLIPPSITSNVGHMPLLLATPPQSPHEKQDTSLSPMDMPLLSALMSNNNLAPTGYIVHIPCFLCKQPFNDVASLRDHLARHATQINRTGKAPLPPPPQYLPYMPPRIPMNINYPDHLAPVSRLEFTNMPSIAGAPPPQLPSYVPPVNVNYSDPFAAVSPLQFANMPPIIKGNSRFTENGPLPYVAPRCPANMPTAMNMNTTYSAPVPAPAPVPTTHPAPTTNPEQKRSEVLSDPPKYVCRLCGKGLRTEVCLVIHERMHNITPEQRKKWNTRAFKCHLCKKSYRLEYNLVKHMHVRHKPLPIAPTKPPAPTKPSASAQPELPSQPTQPTPPSSGDGQITIPTKKPVWSTKLMNAVAAANYSPASEPASKYMSPTEDVNQQSTSKPKQKYALRSPFCNPNLWVDYDNHVP